MISSIRLQQVARHYITLHHKVNAKSFSVPISEQHCAPNLVSKNIPLKARIASHASSNGAEGSSSPPPPPPTQEEGKEEGKGDLDLLVDLMTADDQGEEKFEQFVETNLEYLQAQFFQNCAEALPMMEEQFGQAASQKIRSVLTKVMEYQMSLSPPDYQLANKLSLLETPEERTEMLDAIDQGVLVDVLKLENFRFFKVIDETIIDLDKRRDPNAAIFVERARDARAQAFSRLPKDLQEAVDNKAWLDQKADIDLLFKLLGADEVDQFDQMYEAILEEQGATRFNDKFFSNCMQMVQVIPENDAIMAEKLKKLVEKIFNLQMGKMPLDYQLINVLIMAETKEERKNILDSMEESVLKETIEMEKFRFFALLHEAEEDLKRNAGLMNDEEMANKVERIRDARKQAYGRLSPESQSQVQSP